MPDAVTDARWFVVAGMVFVIVALAHSVLRRLPVTTAIVYLGIGVFIGPIGLGLIRLDPIDDAGLIELVAELAVLVSLFTAGLKLRDPPAAAGTDRYSATLSMAVTVGLLAFAGTILLGLPVGAAVLLGAILAPDRPGARLGRQVTDAWTRPGPVLAHRRGRDERRHRVPVRHARPRAARAARARRGGWRWWAVDVAWGVAGGPAAVVLGDRDRAGKLVLYLRRGTRRRSGWTTSSPSG